MPRPIELIGFALQRFFAISFAIKRINIASRGLTRKNVVIPRFSKCIYEEYERRVN